MDAARKGRPPPEAADEGRMPIVERLLEYRRADYVAFHTPGHKRGAGAPGALHDLVGVMLSLDMCVMPGFEDSLQSAHAVAAGEALAARAWGADRAFLLTNGSSGGLQSLVLAVAGPGETIIVPRNTHQALLTGIVLSGAMPVYVDPLIDDEWGIALAVPPGRVDRVLRDAPAARAVFVTSPTYQGCCADVASMTTMSHEAGVPLVVDQAWGAHLRFCDLLPADAMSLGADAIVTSVHKLLAGITQASLVAARGGRLDLDRLETMARMLQSTSQLALILASIDAARAQMLAEGQALWARAMELAESARARIRRLPGLRCLGDEVLAREGVAAFDPTRLTFSAADLGVSGQQLEMLLRDRYHIAVEAADVLNVVCNVTWADSAASVDALVDALADVAAREAGGGAAPAARQALRLPPPPFTRLVMSPRDAFFGAAQPVPLEQSAGRVSAEIVTPYPPGIPVLGPGEEIGAETVAFLVEARRRGLAVVGARDTSLTTLHVVAGAG